MILLELNQYRKELAIFLDGAEEFVRRRSLSRFKKMLDDLDHTIDSGNPSTYWRARNIDLVVAKRYDRREGKSAPVRVRFGFDIALASHQVKRGYWHLSKCVSHIHVFREDDDAGEHVTAFHIDLKNPEQLGPEVHIQFAETCSQRLGLAMGVPRIPFPAVLPTDCLDFALSEFFPHRWGVTQSGMHALSTVRRAQKARIEALWASVQRSCGRRTRLTPIAAMQDWSPEEDIEF